MTIVPRYEERRIILGPRCSYQGNTMLIKLDFRQGPILILMQFTTKTHVTAWKEISTQPSEFLPSSNYLAISLNDLCNYIYK